MARLALLVLLVAVALDARATDAFADVGSIEAPVVYGNDDRVDVYASGDAQLRAIATTSIVAILPRSAVGVNGSSYSLAKNTLGEALGLCPDLRFYDQPSLAYCSGTLIDDELVLTAGHCMTSPLTTTGKPSPHACGAQRFVFGYYESAPGTFPKLVADDVYECRRIVDRRTEGGLDYAIVQLDRPVVGHAPVAVRAADTELAKGTPIAVIGSPSGLPLKIAAGAEVLDSSGRTFFIGNPDTFAGNSGSGVFDRDGALVGVLVRGANDYRTRPGSSCTEIDALPAGYGQEEMTYVARAKDALCDAGFPSETLCDVSPSCGDGFCTRDEPRMCPSDCSGPVCGDGTCETSELNTGCALDCEGPLNTVRIPTTACTASPASLEIEGPLGKAAASAFLGVFALAIGRSRRRKSS